MPRSKPAPKKPRYRTGAPHRAFMAIANTWRRFRRWVLRLSALVLVLLLAWVLLYRFVAPPGGLFMWQEYRRLGEISRQWVPLHQIAPIMARSVVAAEDANFCRHWGFDMSAIRQVIEQGAARGASTISQQTVKNVFLWHGRDWTRKALESGITLLVEASWPKARIIEVYLNIAEFDEGVFGGRGCRTALFRHNRPQSYPPNKPRVWPRSCLRPKPAMRPTHPNSHVGARSPSWTGRRQSLVMAAPIA